MWEWMLRTDAAKVALVAAAAGAFFGLAHQLASKAVDLLVASKQKRALSGGLLMGALSESLYNTQTLLSLLTTIRVHLDAEKNQFWENVARDCLRTWQREHHVRDSMYTKLVECGIAAEMAPEAFVMLPACYVAVQNVLTRLWSITEGQLPITPAALDLLGEEVIFTCSGIAEAALFLAFFHKATRKSAVWLPMLTQLAAMHGYGIHANGLDWTRRATAKLKHHLAAPGAALRKAAPNAMPVYFDALEVLGLEAKRGRGGRFVLFARPKAETN